MEAGASWVHECGGILSTRCRPNYEQMEWTHQRLQEAQGVHRGDGFSELVGSFKRGEERDVEDAKNAIGVHEAHVH